MKSPTTSVDFPINNAKFVSFGRGVVTSLTTAASTFTSPPVTTATLTGLLNDVDTANGNVAKHVAGAVADRLAKRAKAEGALRLDAAYVDTVAASVPIEQASAIIASSGYKENQKAKRTKPAYAVTRGTKQAAGSVTASVKALGRHGSVMYCHQYSINGGQTWVDCIPTEDTALAINGLPIGQTVSFRFRPLIKGVYGDVSQTLTYVVH